MLTNETRNKAGRGYSKYTKMHEDETIKKALSCKKLLKVGRRYIIYSFTVKDFANIFSVSIYRARQMIREKRFNPRDLQSIADFYKERTTKKLDKC